LGDLWGRLSKSSRESANQATLERRPCHSILSPKHQRAAFATRIGSKNSYVLLPPPANDLTDSLLRDVEGGGQAHNRFALLMASPDLFIAVMVSRRVVGEGHRRPFLTDVYEQHTVVDRLHKMLECLVFKVLWGIWGRPFPQLSKGESCLETLRCLSNTLHRSFLATSFDHDFHAAISIGQLVIDRNLNAQQ
jgi:hypothetical protein